VTRKHLALVPICLLLGGCASGYLRLALSGEHEGIVVVGTEQIPIPKQPYGYYTGTLFDLFCTVTPVWEAVGGSPPIDIVVALALAPMCLLDAPLSAALDTLCLPYDLFAHRRYARAMEAHRAHVEALRNRLRPPGSAFPAPRAPSSGDH
jgi:uncharacterized protein YceK